MTIKAILFDHDGTLVDSEPTHFEMWVNILRPYGITLGLDDYKKYYAGIPTTRNARDMIERYRLKTRAEDLENEKFKTTQSYLDNQAFPLMKGAKESIQHFHQQGLKLAIVTGAGAEGVKSTFKFHHLDEVFTTFVCGDDVTDSKPAPDCYLLAANRLGVKPSSCLAIEDTVNGVTAAVSAGIPCVAVYSAMSQHHDFSQAIQTFDNFKQATDWISANYL